METPRALPLKLTKIMSRLNDLKLVELLPIERVKAVLHLEGEIKPEWGTSKHEQLIARDHANEQTQLEAYLKKFNTKLGGVEVVYKKPRLGFGRTYPVKSLGLTSIRRRLRNTLIQELYYDFDLKNAQPSIIRALCETNQIPCPQITRYCDDRESLLEQVQSCYGVDRDTAKELFIRICFLGTFKGWCWNNRLGTQRALDFISLFEVELKTIAERMKLENPELYKAVRDQNTKKAVNHSPFEDDVPADNKVLASFFAVYNQEYESRVVERVMFHLMDTTPLFSHPNPKINQKVGTYEYDGIKLLSSNVDKLGGPQAVNELLNQITRDLTGVALEWVNKEVENPIPIEVAIRSVVDTETPNGALVADMKVITDALEHSDRGVIETIMSILPKHYIYSIDKNDASKGDWYGWDENRWIKGDGALRKAIMYKVAIFWNSKLSPWDEIFEPMEVNDDSPPANYALWKRVKSQVKERLFELNTANHISACVSVGKTLMAQVFEFDANPDLIGFDNGVFDISTKQFRPFRFDDYITMSVGYNLDLQVVGAYNHTGYDREGNSVYHEITDDDITEEFETTKNKIMETYSKITPDYELRQYLFGILSTGLSGRAFEYFFIFNGEGRNGKGLTNEFMEVVLGDYFVGISPIVFCEDQKKRTSSGPNPELAKLDKKRYVVSKEPPRDIPFQNSVIKEFTGGGNISARNCHSSKSTVKLCLTLVIEANTKPNLAEEPQKGEEHRINDIFFGSRFSTDEKEWNEAKRIYKQEPELKHKFKTCPIYRHTMANILIAYLIGVRDAEYNLDTFKPDSVRERSMAYIQNSYDIHNIFTELFELRVEETATAGLYQDGKRTKAKDEDWTLPAIITHIRNSRAFHHMPRSKQKEYTKEKVVAFFNTNHFYKNLLYQEASTHAVKMRDWRLKPLEKEEEEEA
jgi:hypothetical protein